MFITVTRFGGSTALRLAAAAVAHITPMDDGAVLHLLSGEHLRVAETADDIEAGIRQILMPELAVCEAAVINPAATREDLDELLTKHLGDLVAALTPREVTAAPVVSEPAPDDAANRRGRGRRS